MATGKDLLERLLASESKGEILTLFHKNPGLIDVMDGIARRLGRAREEIESDVKDFLDLGLLKTTEAGKMVLYSLNKEKDKEVQSFLADYFKGLSK